MIIMERQDPKDPHFRIRLNGYSQQTSAYGRIPDSYNGRIHISSYHVDSTYGKQMEYNRKHCNSGMIFPWLYAPFSMPLYPEMSTAEQEELSKYPK